MTIAQGKLQKKRVKVLFILDFLSLGGVERLAYDFLLNSYLNTEFEILLLSFEKGSFESEFKKLPIRHFRFSRKGFVDIRTIRSIKKLIRKENIQIIHSHNIIGDFYAYLASIPGNIKHIRTYHSLGNRKKWKRRVTRFLLNRHTINIAVSDSFKEQLISYYNPKRIDNFKTVYNGIDFRRLKPGNSDIRNELGIPEGELLFGMVGNFVHVKDQLTVCKTMKIIKDNGIKAHQIFVGTHNGTDIYFLKDCIDYCKRNDLMNNVHFIGLRTDVQDILSQIDVFVFSSLLDTFGIALAEAMALNVPCINSDIKPLLEISKNCSYTTCFKTGDEFDLYQKICSYIENRSEFIDKALKAREFVLTNFSIDNHINRSIGLYKKTLLES